MNQKILIIEDTEFDRKIIKKCLEVYGFTNLSFAASGEEGLIKIKSWKPVVVVIDTNLRGMDGFETCEKIKKLDPLIQTIVMTGNPKAVNFPKAREIGVDEYTVKTENCGEIIWSIRRCLKRSV
jgi:CheY-like chemotaxis protein